MLKVYLVGKYAFVEADGAIAAMSLLRTVPVDLVIADVNMPSIDGFEFVRRVRASAESMRSLPIILVTGSKTEDLEQKSVNAAASALLHKPVEAEELLGWIEKLLPR